MNNTHILYIGNTNALELDDLRNEITGEFINDASVVVTLKDAIGAPVAGQSWPATMAYVAASDGLYRAYLQSGLTLTPDARYVAEVTAVSGGSLVGKWNLDVLAKTRR